MPHKNLHKTFKTPRNWAIPLPLVSCFNPLYSYSLACENMVLYSLSFQISFELRFWSILLGLSFDSCKCIKSPSFWFLSDFMLILHIWRGMSSWIITCLCLNKDFGVVLGTNLTRWYSVKTEKNWVIVLLIPRYSTVGSGWNFDILFMVVLSNCPPKLRTIQRCNRTWC